MIQCNVQRFYSIVIVCFQIYRYLLSVVTELDKDLACCHVELGFYSGGIGIRSGEVHLCPSPLCGSGLPLEFFFNFTFRFVHFGVF